MFFSFLFRGNIVTLVTKIKNVDMNNIFYCEPLVEDNGYTWTIVSRLGNIFTEIEELYGPRDNSFTILGVEVANIEQPQIWFPGNNGKVIIQITPDCFNNMGKAIFQIAHEAIHCLNPKVAGTVTVLEEGLATFFSKYYTLKCGYRCEPNMEKYIFAMTCVEKLLSYDAQIILKIRRDSRMDLSKISADVLLDICPQIGMSLATILTTNFKLSNVQ